MNDEFRIMPIIARKSHWCWVCGREIKKGEPYWMIRYKRNLCQDCTRQEAAEE